MRRPSSEQGEPGGLLQLAERLEHDCLRLVESLSSLHDPSAEQVEERARRHLSEARSLRPRI
ncbi:MAG: hypothetical protein ACYS1C_02890, partial [Planctomycetota bacterium]